MSRTVFILWMGGYAIAAFLFCGMAHSCNVNDNRRQLATTCISYRKELTTKQCAEMFGVKTKDVSP